MKKNIVFWTIAITCLLQSCSFYGRRRGPTEWYHIPKPDYTIPDYARFLKGLKICLDPGHGGDAHIGLYKRGPTGVREAEMNLRVAFYLRDFLEKAGAQVVLTRDGDYEIDLDKRAEVATLTNADIFISLHHNAGDNPRTNYASTWYHGDADFRPVSLDLARYIQQSLVDYLRLPNQLPAGLLSDYLMYPAGFGVLRHLTVPGILLESSFFSNPKEEKLLAKPAYNRLEAYAIFLGIARWAAAGIPTVVLREPHPDTTITSKQPTICLQIRDGLHSRKGSWMLTREQYFSRQVTFFLDDSTAPFLLDRDRNLVFHTPEKPLQNGWHTTQAEVTNYFGNHNLPRVARFRIAVPARYLFAKAWCDRLPADGWAFTGIETVALDSDSLMVADDDTIGALTDYGRLKTGKMPARDGKTTFYLQAAPLPGTANLKFATGTALSGLSVIYCDTNATLIEGFCLSRTEQTPLENVNVTLLPDSLRQVTNSDGVYFFPQVTPGNHTLQFSKYGYFSQNRNVLVSDGISNIDTLNLQKVFGGILHEYVIVLDPRFGGKEIGTKISSSLNSAQLNLRLARILQNLFNQAGASVFLLRSADVNLSREQRIQLCNNIPGSGYYLRLNLDNAGQTSVFNGGYYAGSQRGRQILQNIADRLNVAEVTNKSQIAVSEETEVRLTNRAAVSLDLHLNAADNPNIDDEVYLNRIANAIFFGFLKEIGGADLAPAKWTVRVMAEGQPLPNTILTLNSLYPLATDQHGERVFEFIEPGYYNLCADHPLYGRSEKLIEARDQQIILIELFK